MPKFEDLTGKRFGKLTVLNRDEPYIEGNGQRHTKWVCACDCGRKVSVMAASLKSGNTKSCGCAVQDAGIRARADMIGKRFGRLMVVCIAEKRNAVIYYKCVCDCGNSIVTSGHSLRGGSTQSCGCSRIGNNALDLTGQSYGRLLVLGQAEAIRYGDERMTRWKCLCSCGKTAIVTTQNLRSGHTQSCGCLHIEHAYDLRLTRLAEKTDLVNLKFGRLTAQRYAGTVKHNGKSVGYWECQCECGNRCIVRRDCLISGDTRSCGCIQEEYRYQGTYIPSITTDKPTKRSTTGMRGIYLNKKTGKYRVCIGFKGQKYWIGQSKDIGKAQTFRITGIQQYFKPTIESFNKAMQNKDGAKTDHLVIG